MMYLPGFVAAALLATSAPAATPFAASQAADPDRDGRRVDLDYESMEVRKLLRVLGDVAQVQLTVSPEVRGRVTIKLVGVRWRDALDAVSRARRLQYQLSGDRLDVWSAR